MLSWCNRNERTIRRWSIVVTNIAQVTFCFGPAAERSTQQTMVKSDILRFIPVSFFKSVAGLFVSVCALCYGAPAHLATPTPGATGTPAPGLHMVPPFTQRSRAGLNNFGAYGPALMEKLGVSISKKLTPSNTGRRADHEFRNAAFISSSQETNSSARLQQEINHLMVNKTGAVLVMDVASGKVLAQWHLNVAGQRLEPPGSTVKPFVLMELLRAGKINAGQRVMCRRPLYIGGKRMDCSHPESITTLDAPDALAYSCNTYFSTVAMRLDPAQLAGMYKRIGFSSPTGHAPNEVSGRISTAREPYQLQLQALGEWGIEITPLELLAAYQNLARQKLKDENLGSAAPVFDGLERAVKYGMARDAQPDGTTAAGKTGTASGAKTPQSHGFFAGYAPADKPQIVVLVYLEHGRGMDAAAVAGPVISAWWKNKSGN